METPATRLQEVDYTKTQPTIGLINLSEDPLIENNLLVVYAGYNSSKTSIGGAYLFGGDSGSPATYDEGTKVYGLATSGGIGNIATAGFNVSTFSRMIPDFANLIDNVNTVTALQSESNKGEWSFNIQNLTATSSSSYMDSLEDDAVNTVLPISIGFSGVEINLAVDKGSCESGLSLGEYCTVTATADVIGEGVYQGEISIDFDGRTRLIPVSLNVAPDEEIEPETPAIEAPTIEDDPYYKAPVSSGGGVGWAGLCLMILCLFRRK